MAIQTIEEGLALYSLDLLRTEEIPELALLFLAEGCDVSDMAALAGSLAIEHPADRRSGLEPRDAARQIKEISQTVEAELPQARHYVGDAFGISTLIGLYLSCDDIPLDDVRSAREIDRHLLAELTRLANKRET